MGCEWVDSIVKEGVMVPFIRFFCAVLITLQTGAPFKNRKRRRPPIIGKVQSGQSRKRVKTEKEENSLKQTLSQQVKEDTATAATTTEATKEIAVQEEKVESQQQQQPNHFKELPEEIVVLVFSFLVPSKRDLLTLSGIDVMFRRCACHDSLWLSEYQGSRSVQTKPRVGSRCRPLVLEVKPFLKDLVGQFPVKHIYFLEREVRRCWGTFLDDGATSIILNGPELDHYSRSYVLSYLFQQKQPVADLSIAMQHLSNKQEPEAGDSTSDGIFVSCRTAARDFTLSTSVPGQYEPTGYASYALKEGSKDQMILLSEEMKNVLEEFAIHQLHLKPEEIKWALALFTE